MHLAIDYPAIVHQPSEHLSDFLNSRKCTFLRILCLCLCGGLRIHASSCGLGIAAGTMCSSSREDPEGVLVRFEETFRTILFVLDSIALAVVQVAFLYHQKCLSATMT